MNREKTPTLEQTEATVTIFARTKAKFTQIDSLAALQLPITPVTIAKTTKNLNTIRKKRMVDANPVVPVYIRPTAKEDGGYIIADKNELEAMHIRKTGTKEINLLEWLFAGMKAGLLIPQHQLVAARVMVTDPTAETLADLIGTERKLLS